MPPVPPLVTSTVAVDRNGNAWLYEPAGIAKPLDLMPLGSTNPGTTPPANPQTGWLWWDTGTNELKAWNGTTWIASAGGGSGGIGEPTTAGSFLRTNTGTWVAGLPLTGGTLTGDVVLDAASTNQIFGRRGGVNRWLMSVGNFTVSGTHFTLQRYDDSGMVIDTVLTIQRSAGIVTFNSNIAPGLELQLNAVAGRTRELVSTVGTTRRWSIVLGNATAEALPQTGANFAIQRYTNAGVLLDAPLSIERATGAVTIPNLQGYLRLVQISAAEPATAQDGEIWVKDEGFGNYAAMIRVAGQWINLGSLTPGPW